jgi:hypothetical protein
VRRAHRKKLFSFISLLAPKKRTKEKAPCNSAFGCPSETHARGVGKNSHIWALRQLADRVPRAHASLGIVATGL